MILDLLATNNWERPVYFAITVGSDSYMKLEPYFQLEGLAYRLVPFVSQSGDGQVGRIATDIMYDNLINKFVWGNINDPKVYLDENNLRMTMNLRNNFARLADALIAEGKIDSAITVLDRCIEVMPEETVPYNVFVLGVAEAYYKIAKAKPGDPKYAAYKKNANQIITKLATMLEEELDYFFSLPDKFVGGNIASEKQRNMAIMQEIVRLTGDYEDTEINKELEKRFQELYTKFMESI
jgi:hypothetical protein